MPVKKLTSAQQNAFDRLFDGITDDDDDLERMEYSMNHFFAKIYGYDRSIKRRSTRKGQIRKTSRRAYTKTKLSAWQKFIKANSKKKKFKFANGKLKLKAMGVAYRKTAAYKRNQKK